MIAGFEVPDAGHVRLRGQDITHTAPEARGIGFVFQDYALFPHLTVLDNVKFGLRNLTRAKATARAEEMLRMVGLAGLAARRPHELSGGQQQRVALARTLAMAPPLVLMDEPFSNLDAAMRVETRQEVRKLLKQTGAAGIIVTHDQEEAMAVADRIAVMEAGRIVQIGTPDEIYRYPVSAFVASFIGRSNILNGKADGMESGDRIRQIAAVAGGQWGGHAVGAARTDHAGSGPRMALPLWLGANFRGHDQLYWVQEGERCLQVISGAGGPRWMWARACGCGFAIALCPWHRAFLPGSGGIKPRPTQIPERTKCKAAPISTS